MKKISIIILLFCLPLCAAPPPVFNIEKSRRNFERMQEDALYQKYYGKIALIESTQNYNAINKIGAIGRYQFLPSTLRDLGIHITSRQFRNNPDSFSPKMQDSIMKIHTFKNEMRLKYLINSHPEINKFAILAAAHFAGVQGAKDYFYKGQNKKDCNGKKISEYIKYFQ